MQEQQDERLKRAYVALEGLSVGDAFGEQFFTFANVAEKLTEHQTPPAPWHYTDDTQMAFSIVSTLQHCGIIDQDDLAQPFAERYQHDPGRGYGAGMHRLLPQIRSGSPWSTATSDLFSGQGSFGNGAAMRVVPLRAFFADDLDAVVENAHHSAEVTHAHAHAHPEGITGALAVALAAAWAWRLRDVDSLPNRSEFIDLILPHLPDGETSSIIRRARDLSSNAPVQTTVGVLGSGFNITAQDTVPFVLWCAGESLTNYAEALWLTATGLGDVDTTCAMVGGIVASYTGVEGILNNWHAAREPLPDKLRMQDTNNA
ncbi:MAG: ADP-ribosylglycohydrolase [Chloroflexi bacterium AL-W]|nr:ADP-ribosylglycohydrolase [Chloroflexi bacterium AL-N1]NOK65687.1 ADP-ribosylglycohydrolase [Chloroflexi bacterium AL-N10]NOK74372.1 ADP-ribosylglycohydrolase [Chloroflexi bacterium AL-N5]NOK80720.1 ADP-ribosylglycohydrolase [Chloroflexi bacterium AL-W]NOK88630.1 ADP-ribosylglycohydrolase [Chloroflexi bacterium AL-N15]